MKTVSVSEVVDVSSVVLEIDVKVSVVPVGIVASDDVVLNGVYGNSINIISTSYDTLESIVHKSRK